MTSHELAEKLLRMPDVTVTRRGYEGGVTEITTVNEPRFIHFNVHEPEAWYYGRHKYHETVYECDECKNFGTTEIKAIHID